MLTDHVQIPNKPPDSPIDSHVTLNTQLASPNLSSQMPFHYQQKYKLCIPKFLSHNTRVAAIASLVSQPLLNPYWSRPKNDSALLSSLRISILVYSLRLKDDMQ